MNMKSATRFGSVQFRIHIYNDDIVIESRFESLIKEYLELLFFFYPILARKKKNNQ